MDVRDVGLPRDAERAQNMYETVRARRIGSGVASRVAPRRWHEKCAASSSPAAIASGRLLDVRDEQLEHAHLERLFEHPVGDRREELFDALLRRAAGREHEALGERRRGLADPLEQLHAAHRWHRDITDHQVEVALRLDRRECFFAVRRKHELVCGTERALVRLENVRLVVDEQDP